MSQGGFRLAKLVARAKTAKSSEHRSSKYGELIVSRPELLADGDDRQFRELRRNVFSFHTRHQMLREGFAAFINLPAVEYTMLIAIRDLASTGDVHVRDVAKELILTGAFVTTVTNKLQAKGLIGKVTHEADRRRQCLTVTAKGQKLLDDLAPVQRTVHDVQFGELSTREFQQLQNLMQKLATSSEQAVSLLKYLVRSPAAKAPAPAKPARKSKKAEA